MHASTEKWKKPSACCQEDSFTPFGSQLQLQPNSIFLSHHSSHQLQLQPAQQYFSLTAFQLQPAERGDYVLMKWLLNYYVTIKLLMKLRGVTSPMTAKVITFRFHSNPSIQTSDGLAPTLCSPRTKQETGTNPTQQPNKTKVGAIPKMRVGANPTHTTPNQTHGCRTTSMCLDGWAVIETGIK